MIDTSKTSAQTALGTPLNSKTCRPAGSASTQVRGISVPVTCPGRRGSFQRSGSGGHRCPACFLGTRPTTQSTLHGGYRTSPRPPLPPGVMVAHRSRFDSPRFVTPFSSPTKRECATVPKTPFVVASDTDDRPHPHRNPVVVCRDFVPCGFGNLNRRLCCPGLSPSTNGHAHSLTQRGT